MTFLSMPRSVLKKSGEPYKKFSGNGEHRIFINMGGYAKRKAAELGGRIYKGENSSQDHTEIKRETACD